MSETEVPLRDERPYEYAEKQKKEQKVKYRIPDATMGLRSYNDREVERGYWCTADNCTIDHSNNQPHKSLIDRRLRDQMYNPKSGLIVDGI